MLKRRRRRLYLDDSRSFKFSVVCRFGFRFLNIVFPHVYADSHTVQVNCRTKLGEFSYEQLALIRVGGRSWIIDGVGCPQHVSKPMNELVALRPGVLFPLADEKHRRARFRQQWHLPNSPCLDPTGKDVAHSIAAEASWNNSTGRRNHVHSLSPVTTYQG